MNKTFERAALAAVLSAAALLAPAAHAGVAVSVTIAPPPLPYYVQPPIPGDGYLWTPGYWSWDPATGDYVWVPGTWVLPPAVGLLWTPGWWGFVGGAYVWHAGYWGPHVGYYGGIRYGYGYDGHGYRGGRWEHGRFAYDRAFNNVPHGRVHAFYGRPNPVFRPGAAHESFNGPGSHFHAPPTRDEQRWTAAPHMPSRTVSGRRPCGCSCRSASTGTPHEVEWTSVIPMPSTPCAPRSKPPTRSSWSV